MIFVMKQPILYTDTANQRKAADRKTNVCDEEAECVRKSVTYNFFTQFSNKIKSKANNTIHLYPYRRQQRKDAVNPWKA